MQTVEQPRRLGAIAWLLLAAGSCSDIDFDLERYKQAVKSGFKKIPQSVEMERLFGECDHFISYSGSLDVGQQWTTEIYLHGRYRLTMYAPVRTDRRFSRITEVRDEPTFQINEIRRIKTLNGQIGASFGDQFVFTADDWKKVVAADGDFSAININLKRNRPVAGVEAYINAWRRDRIHVRPDPPRPEEAEEEQPESKQSEAERSKAEQPRGSSIGHVMRVQSRW